MRKRRDAPENRREIARQPSAKTNPAGPSAPPQPTQPFQVPEYFGIIGKFVKTTLTPQP